MKMDWAKHAFLTTSLACMALTGWTAPSLPVTKPYATPNPSYTGPTNDSHAISGQWFLNLANSNLEFRTHEFYDNPSGTGGAMGHLAISGRVINVTTDFGAITSFEVEATIYNDAPAATGWLDGTNSHQEALSTTSQYTNSLVDTILTVDFAVIGDENGSPINLPAFGSLPEGTPYRDVYSSIYILTTNNHYAAWYCWTDEHTGTDAPGNFHVPGWSFGSIAPGQAVTQILSFFIPNKLQPGDPRYDIIMNARDTEADIFANRSQSLKISEWITDPAADDASPGLKSTVSVFHNTLAGASYPISIRSIHYTSVPPTVLIQSVGTSNGLTQQVIQYSTNLMATNWISLATNMAQAYPATNSWVHSNVTDSIQFYRIVEP